MNSYLTFSFFYCYTIDIRFQLKEKHYTKVKSDVYEQYIYKEVLHHISLKYVPIEIDIRGRSSIEVFEYCGKVSWNMVY